MNPTDPSQNPMGTMPQATDPMNQPAVPAAGVPSPMPPAPADPTMPPAPAAPAAPEPMVPAPEAPVAPVTEPMAGGESTGGAPSGDQGGSMPPTTPGVV